MSRARDLASNVTALDALASDATALWALASDAAALDALAEIRAMLVARGVATVSQVGGVPTGGIVESGSNANGSYTKFADGTAFIRMNGNEVRGATGVLSTVLTLPITMIAGWRGALTILATEATAGLVTWKALDNHNANDVTVRISRSTTGSTSFSVIGFGRWY